MAQSPARILDQNLNSWWIYSGDHPIKGPWGVFTEVQVRRSDFVDIWQQLQIRDAATYRFSGHVQVAAGYVWTKTGRYGDFPAARPYLEHRAYQQLAFKQELKRLDIEHRFRLEQRWFQNFTTGDAYYWRYQNRVRYQFKVSLPISKANTKGQQWFVSGADEIAFQFGPNHGPDAFDQNRAVGSIGYKLSPSNKVEVGYMNQFLLQRNGRIEESNHILRVQFTSTAKLFQHK